MCVPVRRLPNAGAELLRRGIPEPQRPLPADSGAHEGGRQALLSLDRVPLFSDWNRVRPSRPVFVCKYKYKVKLENVSRTLYVCIVLFA